jgi:hypothetical protein
MYHPNFNGLGELSQIEFGGTNTLNSIQTV